MARTGRPKKEIDWDMFDKLCGIQCTRREIAAWFDVSEDTIERLVKKQFHMTFAARFEEKKGIGKISLRRSMFQLAQKGNATMLIWLSKNHLDMTDKVDQKIDQVTSEKITYKVKWADEEELGSSTPDATPDATAAPDQQLKN